MVSVFYRHWGPIDRLFFLLPVISYCIMRFFKMLIFIQVQTSSRTAQIVNCSLFVLSNTLILHHVRGALLGALNDKFWPY